MLFIFTALYCEAYPFIQYYHLKKDVSQTRFQVFKDKEEQILLTITGVGTVAAAAAIGSVCTQYHADKNDFLINVGICAGKEEKGKIFLGNKIIEAETGKTFYPDLLYCHRFTEAEIITSATACSKTESYNSEFLYDMEASAVYQAGNYFFGPHRMVFLKIISDDGNPKDVTLEDAKSLVAKNLEKIAEYLHRLSAISQMEGQKKAVFQSADKITEKICRDMHCSCVMAASVRQYIYYLALSGKDYMSLIEEMYIEKKLPCKGKREGKNCFEEFKRRLL